MKDNQIKSLINWFKVRKGKTLKLNNEGIDCVIEALSETLSYTAVGTVDEFKSLKEHQPKCADCAGCTAWKCDCTNIRYESIDEFAERLCAACCENTFHATINGIQNVEMMTLDGVTETIFEVAEKMKGGAKE